MRVVRAVGRGLLAAGLLAIGLALVAVATPADSAEAEMLRFSSISASSDTSCGVATSGVGYCWGYDDYGQFGDGDVTIGSPIPTPVGGGFRWLTIEVGDHHACGVTAEGAGYCWGSGSLGQRGDGTTSSEVDVPVPVLGGHRWAMISAG